jgi:hypothetical protein
MGSLQNNIVAMHSMFDPFPAFLGGMKSDQTYEVDQSHLNGLSQAFESLSAILLFPSQRNANSTSAYEYEQIQYVGRLEKDNLSLSCRIAELEKENASMKMFMSRMKPLEVYVPSILKLVDEHLSAYENVASKIEFLKDKHSLKEAEFELWGGAKKAIDVSPKTLDEILDEIE